MKTSNKRWYLKLLAQLSLVVTVVADLSSGTCCWWFLNQPKVPEELSCKKLRKN